jgi:hypothetical protein
VSSAKGMAIGDVVGMDEFALTHIDPDLLTLEERCYQSKWFDYRHLHPTLATVHFARTYHQIVAEYMEREVDYKKGEAYRRRMGNFDVRTAKPRTISNYWRARQQADLLGMKYDIFIRSIFRALRDRGWKRIPNANHLYSRESLGFALAGWERELEGSVMWPRSSLLNAGSDAWFKESYDAWLVAQLLKRPNFKYLIEKAVKDGVLTTDSIRKNTRPVLQ